MFKKKKIQILCDECTRSCDIAHKEKAEVQCCPFCGEPVSVRDDEQRPLLRDFEEMDEFNEEDYYEDSE